MKTVFKLYFVSDYEKGFMNYMIRLEALAVVLVNSDEDLSMLHVIKERDGLERAFYL